MTGGLGVTAVVTGTVATEAEVTRAEFWAGLALLSSVTISAAAKRTPLTKARGRTEEEEDCLEANKLTGSKSVTMLTVEVLVWEEKFEPAIEVIGTRLKLEVEDEFSVTEMQETRFEEEED